MIYTHAAAAIGGAVIAGALSWQVQGWRLGEQIASIQQAHAEASTKAQADTRAAEQAFAQQLQKAHDESAQRETKLRSDAAAARRTADGLRSTIYQFRADLPSAAPATILARADTAAELLGTCADEYRSVAEAADRHAADSVMLRDAWPSQIQK
jgi:hypothetical protein